MLNLIGVWPIFLTLAATAAGETNWHEALSSRVGNERISWVLKIDRDVIPIRDQSQLMATFDVIPRRNRSRSRWRFDVRLESEDSELQSRRLLVLPMSRQRLLRRTIWSQTVRIALRRDSGEALAPGRYLLRVTLQEEPSLENRIWFLVR